MNENLIGLEFNKWTVKSLYARDSSSRKRWLCECSCGTIRPIIEKALKNNSSKSCGNCYSVGDMNNRV